MSHTTTHQPDNQHQTPEPLPAAIENQKSKIENPTAEYRTLPAEQILPNPNQPRKQFALASLQELADSIRQHGILQPLLVRPMGHERYELIAGERRLRAAALAGVTHLPVLVQHTTNRQQTERALIENLQREDLNPVETARAFHTLMYEYGLTQQELSQRTGKSQSVISRLTRLLQLPDAILDALQRGEILERHTRALLAVRQREVRDRLCQRVLEEKLSASETELRIRLVQTGQAALEPPALASGDAAQHAPAEGRHTNPILQSEITTLGLQLAAHFNTDVYASLYKEGTGSITIECQSPAHLLRMANALLKTEF